MSAFVLEDSFFNQLASELVSRIFSTTFKYKIEKFVGVDSYIQGTQAVESAVSKRVMGLRQANYDAFNQAYNRNDKPSSLLIRDVDSKWSDAQLIKNLQCLRYQMDEGTVGDSEIFNKLDKFIGRLSEAFVEANSDYDSLVWGG